MDRCDETYMTQRFGYILYSLLSILFLLTFGIFNSLLKDYYGYWVVITLIITTLIFFFYYFVREYHLGYNSYFTILITAYALCIILNSLFHFSALLRANSTSFLNVTLSNVRSWRNLCALFTSYYLFFPLFLLLQCKLLSGLSRKRVVRILSLVASLSILVIYYQALLDHAFLSKWKAFKFDGLAVDANSYALGCLLTMPLFAWGAMFDKNLRWRTFFVLIYLLQFGSIFFTGSRTAIIGIVLILFGTIIVVMATTNSKLSYKRFLPVLVIVLMVGYVIAGNIKPQTFDGVYRLKESIGILNKIGLADWFFNESNRGNHLLIAYGLTKKAPLSGWGAGGHYREAPNEWFSLTSSFHYWPDSALNHYLMIAGDFGIPMLIVNLIIFIIPLTIGFRSVGNSSDKDEKAIFLLLILSIIIFLICSINIPPSYFPDVIWLLSTNLTILCSHNENKKLLTRLPWKHIIYIVIGSIGITSFGYAHTTYGKYGYSNRQKSGMWQTNDTYGLFPYKEKNGVKIIPLARNAAISVIARSDFIGFRFANECTKNDANIELTIDDMFIHEIDMKDNITVPLYVQIPNMKGRRISIRTMMLTGSGNESEGLLIEPQKATECIAMESIQFLEIAPPDKNMYTVIK